MELMKKETFYYRYQYDLIEPMHCAFFKEEAYQGYTSHQAAVLAFLEHENRVWAIEFPHLVPGLKQKLDQVPEVEVTLSPEVEARIEAGANAQAEADRQAKIRFLKSMGKSIDYEKLQQRFEESRQIMAKIRKESRKYREADFKEFPQLYELTKDVKLVYTKDTSFDSYKGFPIRLNPEKMQGTKITTEDFFDEEGEYKIAFCSYIMVHRTLADFRRANEHLFPHRQELVIYQWNTDFTNAYNAGRRDDGAYLWSIYDRKTQQLIVIDLELIIS